MPASAEKNDWPAFASAFQVPGRVPTGAPMTGSLRLLHHADHRPIKSARTNNPRPA